MKTVRITVLERPDMTRDSEAARSSKHAVEPELRSRSHPHPAAVPPSRTAPLVRLNRALPTPIVVPHPPTGVQSPR